MAIQARIAAGETIAPPAAANGLACLLSVQNTDGGFPYDPAFDPDSDTNSTAYVVQAILAAREDPAAGRWKTAASDPIEYLLSMQVLAYLHDSFTCR